MGGNRSRLIQSDLETRQQRQLSRDTFAKSTADSTFCRHRQLQARQTHLYPHFSPDPHTFPSHQGHAQLCVAQGWEETVWADLLTKRHPHPPSPVNPNAFLQLATLLSTHETNDAYAKESVGLPHCLHPCMLFSKSPSPSKYHTTANAVFFFCQASPDASARCPTLPGPQVVSSRWDLAKTQLPSWRAPIHVAALRGDRSPLQSTLSPSLAMLGEAQKHPFLSSLPERWGRNLLLFLLNDMPESYRALAMQLSITASQGGAKTQGKPMAAQGKYITPGQLKRAKPSGEQIGVQVERFI